MYARLSRRIYDELKADLLSLKVRPGTVLQEQELAHRYGGSRTPIREALTRLVSEGLVSRAGRVYAAKEFSVDEVQHLYELREALEKMAARLTIERATEAEIEALVAQVDQHEAADDAALFNHLDSRFHITIAQLARNPLLEHQTVLVHDKVQVIRHRELSYHRGMVNATADHRRIADAVRRRDVAIAEAEVGYHVRSVIALFRGFHEPRPDGALVPNAEGKLPATRLAPGSARLAAS